MQPQTRYTTVGDSMIAYQVVGDGPLDLVLLVSVASNIEILWEYPPCAKVFERLASFSRLILFDRRGTGLSDPVPFETIPTYEYWNEDLTAVLDAVGSERAAFLCEVDSGPWGMFFAATYPERTRALILWNTFARSLIADDYPMGWTEEANEANAELLLRTWGTEELARMARPDADEEAWRWSARRQRHACTPATAVARIRAGWPIDMRHVLPTIQVPTLVLHNVENAFVPIDAARYLAEYIPNARLVELPGGSVEALQEISDDVVATIEEFLTGVPPVRPSDRVLATVLYTDIVGSTERAAAVGDERWRRILDVHDRESRALVDRFGGRVIKSTGDGILATFDGPGKAIKCADALRIALSERDIAIRAGMHSGEIEVREDGDIGGIAVHIGARVRDYADANEIVCSRTVKDLVAGSGITFTERGTHTLKGVPDDWQLYAVEKC